MENMQEEIYGEEQGRISNSLARQAKEQAKHMAKDAAKKAAKEAAKKAVKKAASKISMTVARWIASLVSAKVGSIVAVIAITIVVVLVIVSEMGVFGRSEQENKWFETAANQEDKAEDDGSMKWATKGFAENWPIIGWTNWMNYSPMGFGAYGTNGEVNVFASMPERTKDLRDVDGRFIANAIIPPNLAVPENNKEDHVVCEAGLEMHLATTGSDKNPWEAHQQLDLMKQDPVYSQRYTAELYMTGVMGSYVARYPKMGQWPGPCTLQQFIDSGSPTDIQFPKGAFGGMKPEDEKFYVNMRWPYTTDWPSIGGPRAAVGEQSDYKGKKVLIVNKANGKMAIGIVGEWGPGKYLGKIPGNRMAGISPDLMCWLTDGSKSGGNQPIIEIAFLKDQLLPPGPFVVGPGGMSSDSVCGDWEMPKLYSNRIYNYRGDGERGLQVGFDSALNAMIADAARQGLNISKGDCFRTYEQQAQLKREKPNLAATPGKSLHEYGIACDLVYGNAAARQFAHAYCQRYGLEFPLPEKEPWHIQPITYKRSYTSILLKEDGVVVKPDGF